MKFTRNFIVFQLIMIGLSSCTTTGPSGLFGKKSPHERYHQSLIDAGLDKSAIGHSWFAAAEQSLTNPLKVNVPYKETGYFPAEKVRAFAIRFDVSRGEKITINLEKKPLKNFTIFIDLWEVRENGNKKLLAYADTGSKNFNYDVDDNGTYIIRLQPELLSAGEYSLTIVKGPSLAFPVKNGKSGSFWGSDRDGGSRKHEGIDIFAPRRAPALAAANGTISRVTINRLGGKVIYMKPERKDYSLYYAHLDEQLVAAGQKVKVGDTIGLVGNTGNAILTPPHLHFGIYTFSGAVDPLAFVNPNQKPLPAIKASLSNIGKSVRISEGSILLRDGVSSSDNVITTLSANSLLEVSSATDKSYRVVLPDGREGFINSTAVSSVSGPLQRIKLSAKTPLYDRPAITAARKTMLRDGSIVSILGNYNDFYFVNSNETTGWISKIN